MTGEGTLRLGDVACVISGYAFKSSLFSDQGVPVVKIANIRSGYLDLSDTQKVDEENFERLNEKYRVNPGDILISLTGSHVTQPNSVVGRVAQAPQVINKCLLNQRAGKVILKRKDRCDPGFLYRYLTVAAAQGAIASMASGAASQANVSPSQVESLPLFLPPLEKQKSIDSILSAYDDLIENNTRRIEILEEMARRLYEEWFVHFRFPGHEEVSFKESELGRIPEEWNVGQLGDVVELVKERYREESHNGLRLLDLSRLPRRSSAAFEMGDPNEIGTSRIVFDEGDVLFGSIRPYFHKVLRSPVPAVTNVSVLVLRSVEKLDRMFSWMLLFADETVAWASQNSGGTKMPVIKWSGVFEKMAVVIPSLEHRERFSSIVLPMAQRIRNLTLEVINLRAQRDLLLPKLVSGEIDVSDIPMPNDKEVEAA